MEKHGWGQYSFGQAELLAAGLTVVVVLTALLFAALGKKTDPDPIPEQYIEELASIMEMMAAAPREGDFEILYPSKISEKDITVMRIDGKVAAILRQLTEQDCQAMSRAAAKGPFDFVLIQRQQDRTTYEVGDFDYQHECEGGAQSLELLQG